MALGFDRLRGVALVTVVAVTPAAAYAQNSQSVAPVTELVKALESKKLDSFAAKGASPNEYVGALYFPGSQLLVVGAKFDTPWRADSLIEMKNYRDLYIELNSASVPQSKTFVSDLGANGLRFKKDGNLFDTADVAGKTFNFDGDWKKAKISEDEYTKTYASTDQQYVQMVQLLLTALK